MNSLELSARIKRIVNNLYPIYKLPIPERGIKKDCFLQIHVKLEMRKDKRFKILKKLEGKTDEEKEMILQEFEQLEPRF